MHVRSLRICSLWLASSPALGCSRCLNQSRCLPSLSALPHHRSCLRIRCSKGPERVLERVIAFYLTLKYCTQSLAAHAQYDGCILAASNGTSCCVHACRCWAAGYQLWRPGVCWHCVTGHQLMGSRMRPGGRSQIPPCSSPQPS